MSHHSTSNPSDLQQPPLELLPSSFLTFSSQDSEIFEPLFGWISIQPVKNIICEVESSECLFETPSNLGIESQFRKGTKGINHSKEIKNQEAGKYVEEAQRTQKNIM